MLIHFVSFVFLTAVLPKIRVFLDIIIIIYCIWVVTRWQWLFYV